MTIERTIRPARESDMQAILGMIAHSRSVMRANGNDCQWGDGYPGDDDVGEDIGRGIGRMIVEAGRPIGYFALLRTPEPTYGYIAEGDWIDLRTPYCTLHRLAAAPGTHGIAEAAFAWAEGRCDSLRADTHRSNHIMLGILRKRGYCRCGVVYMADGSPREAYQKMMYPMVRPDLRAYIEERVLPQYDRFDSAHGRDHALAVMARSMELAADFGDADPEMVYVAAACHDIGLCRGREQHHAASGRMIREDVTLGRWFSPPQVETIAQAAEDHRASAGRPPRSLYGRLVAEADRCIEPATIVRRTAQYGLAHFPALDHEAQWRRCLAHLKEKYAAGGYLSLLIPHSRNEAKLEELRRLIGDESALRRLYEQVTAEELAQQQPCHASPKTR